MIIGIVNAETEWDDIQKWMTRSKGSFAGKIVPCKKGPFIDADCELGAPLESWAAFETPVIIGDKLSDETC